MNLSAVNRSVQLLSRLFDPSRTTEPFLPPVTGKPLFESGIRGTLPRITPEEAGVPSEHLTALLLALRENPHLRMHTLTVLRHGSILCEASFGAHDVTLPRYTFSTCKSIVSLAVGILCGMGVLSTDDKIVDLFSDRIGPVQRLRLSSLTVEHLLTMRSGILFNELESQTDEDWVRCFLNSAQNAEPGTRFAYNSLNTYMLAAIVVRLSGTSLSDFLTKHLFTPLGIKDFFWETCPQGIERGGWGLYMRAEDLAKIGLLLLADGVWEGKRLIPHDYLARAVSPIVKTPDTTGRYDYGYQIWVGHKPRAYLFNGMFGQNVLIFPETDVVVVSGAANDELFQISPFYDTVTEMLGTAGVLSDTPLPCASAEAAYHLKRTLLLCADRTEEAEALARTAQGDPPAEAASPHRKLPGLLARLAGLLSQKNEAPLLPAASTATLPERAARFLKKTFVPADGSACSSVGLLPVILQVTQSSYTQGFCGISFDTTVDNGSERLLVTYREENDTHIFQAGTNTAVRTVLHFHGTPFLAAARVSFPTDEDGNDVCRLQIDFPETPCTRIIKLFLLPDGSCRFRQEETPGAPLLERAVMQQKSSLSEQPVIGAALEKIDNDYLAYRIRRTLSPKLNLTEKANGIHSTSDGKEKTL